VKSTYRQLQVNESGSVELANGKARFTFLHGGKTDSDSEAIEPLLH